MKELRPDLESAQIVLKGDFNPAIFHPSWLAARGLIKEKEADGAEVSAITPEFAVFSVEWFSIEARKDTFAILSSDPSRYLFLSDLVTGIFTYLEFTPLRLMGLNRRMHFRVDSEMRYHELGDMWAPKEAWKDLLIGDRPGGLPGLRSLTMEGKREDCRAQYLRVKVEPSIHVTPGIYFETNEHYQLNAEAEPLDPFEVLSEDWKDALDYTNRIARHLLTMEAK